MTREKDTHQPQLIAELEQARDRIVRLKSRMTVEQEHEDGSTASITDVSPGDHLCCIFRDEQEHQAVLVPFIRSGLEKGHKILSIADAHTVDAVLHFLQKDGVSTAKYVASGQLVVATSQDTYLQGGRFDPDGMIAWLRQEADKAQEEGYGALRVAGEMSWALRGLAGSERLMEYEAKLNRFLPEKRAIGLCQYDMRRFEPEVILHVLETHPFVIVGDRCYENFFYLSPEEFLGPNRAEAELNRRLEQLERQRMDDEALASSEENYRELFNYAQVGIFQTDSSGGVHRLNAEMARILGASSPEEAMARYRDLSRDLYLHPERRNTFLQILREQGGVEHFEYEARHLSGGSVWLSMNARIHGWLPDGTFIIDGFVWDITERKRAEAASRESENKFRNIFNSSNDAIFIHDFNAQFLEVNDAACERLGYTREELLGMSPMDIDAPEAAQVVAERMQYLHRKGSICFESTHQGKEGHQIPVEITSRLIDYEGRKCILSTARDISDRKAAEAERDEYQRLLSSTFHAMDSMFMVIDRDYRIVLCNWRDHEWVPEEKREQRPHCYRVMKNFDAPCEHCPPAQSFHDGRIRRYEDQNPLDHSFKEIDVLPVRSEDGEVRYVLEKVRDITERKLFEEKIQHFNRVLSAIRNVNQLIATEKDRHRLLQGACDRLVETRGYDSAWIASFDDSGDPSICVEAGVGSPFLDLAQNLREGQFPGCARKAFDRNDVVEVGETEAFCSGCPLYGIYPGSVEIAAPLEHRGFVYGTLVVSMSGVYAADEEELELVREVTGDIAFALYDIDLEEDRVRAEIALQESERFLRSTLDGLSAHIAVLDGTGEIVQVNRAWRNFAEASGISAEDVSEGANYLTACSHGQGSSANEAELFARGIREVIAGEREFFSLEYPCPDQERERWFIGQVTPFPETAPRRVAVAHVEITEQKMAERALRESEEGYRDLFNNSPVGIHLTDSEGRVYYVNPALVRMLGASSQDELKACYRELSSDLYVHPQRRKELVRLLREEGKAESFESKVRRVDGAQIWISEHLKIREWLSEDHFLIDGFSVDITERKKAEEALRRKSEEQTLLLESVPTQIWYLTDIDRCGAVNQARADFCGLPKEMMEHKNMWEFLSDEEAHNCCESNIQVFQTGQRIHTEEWLRNAEGEQRLVEIIKTPKLSLNGEVEYVVCAGADITERKRMEERLREMGLYDGLTGLYNRFFFEEEMHRLSDERYLPMGIIVCDINGLKLINDSFGHKEGDELLQRKAEILGRCFRSSDVTARIGGDEFAVLLPQSDESIARKCCDRIREEISRYNEQSPEIGLSVSIGYAVTMSPPLDMSELFKRADDAMYKQKLQQTYSSRSEMVQALIKTMEARDHVTQGHAGRLEEYVMLLGRSLGLPEDRLNDLHLLARFHDLGKVGVPDRILFKPGPLTDEEYTEMKRHCEIGHRIALSLTDLAPIADFILKHHEWWNGEGYPQGVAGKEIPLECRILAIADAYDAMTSDRPYRKAWSQEEAVLELRSCAGTQFDPELVELFVRIQAGGSSPSAPVTR